MRGRCFPAFVFGVLVGGALGVLGAMLLSPVTGSETRRAIRLQLLALADLAKTVADHAEDAADYLGDQVGRALGGDDEIAWRKVREIRAGVARYSSEAQTQ